MREEHILQRIALYSFAIMSLIWMITLACEKRVPGRINNNNELYDEQSSVPTVIRPQPSAIPTTAEKMSILESQVDSTEVWEVWNLLSEETMNALSELFQERCILIKKPEGVTECRLEEDLLHHSITLVLYGNVKETPDVMNVLRVREGEYTFGTLKITPTPLPTPTPTQSAGAKEETKINETSPSEQNGQGQTPSEQAVQEQTPSEQTGQREDSKSELSQNELLMRYETAAYEDADGTRMELTMMLHGYYHAFLKESDGFYIITLVKPKELYKRIVVVDAGHGGKDPGASSGNKLVKEAAVNLKLLLYLKELLDANPEIQAYYTRLDDTYPTLPERVELANGVEADFFVSFHCNSSTNPNRNGTQMLYNAEQGKGEPFNGEAFARLCMKELTKAIGTRNDGTGHRPYLHIVRRANMPMVLVETAYLSNAGDLAILQDEEKLRLAAGAIYNSILTGYQKTEDMIVNE